MVVFNSPFELGRLKECSELLLEFKPWVAGIKRRIVDLLLPFRRFHYYHAKQNGSASMKAVLPALTGRGYDQLAIQDPDVPDSRTNRAINGAQRALKDAARSRT